MRASARPAESVPRSVSSRPWPSWGTVLIVNQDMCHGCGGCLAVCPEDALSPTSRELGEVIWGQAHGNGFVMGRLRVGEAMSPPLMRSVRRRLATMLADKTRRRDRGRPSRGELSGNERGERRGLYFSWSPSLPHSGSTT